MAQYDYDKDGVDTARLIAEMLANPTLLPVMGNLGTVEDDGTPSPGLNLHVEFNPALTGPQETALNGVVAAHPLPSSESDAQGDFLNTFNATTDPTVTDDDASGYGVGSEWRNVSADRAWTCLDASTGAAVWKLTSGEVDATATIADNAMVKGDGGGKNVQATGILVSDNNEVRHVGTVEHAKGADIASAATLVLGTDGNYFDVTGAVTITAISAKPAGTQITLRFDAILTVTHNAASLRLRDGQNYVTVAGDHLTLVCHDGTNWREVSRSTGNTMVTDDDAIHDNVANEIALITEKVSPVGADILVIEDSENSNEKRRLQIGNLPGFQAGNDAYRVVVEVQKGSAGTINPGDVVYLTGYDNGAGFPEVELADSSASATMPGFGIAVGSITDTTEGKVVVTGRVENLDTSAFSVSDDLYVSETPGELTNVAPQGTALVQKIAQVVRSNASTGIIQVFGAGRSNALPNLAQDNVWVGDANGVPQEVASSTFGGQSLYDAIVPDDYATPGAAFAAGGIESVFVRDGTHVETQDIVIPANGTLVGASADGTIIDLSGGYSVVIDGSGTDYSAGTISVVNNSTTVVGVGTTFQTAGIAAGDWLLLGIGDKCWTQIASVDSETGITLAEPWQGQTVTGGVYEIKSFVAGLTLSNLTLRDNSSGSGIDLTNVIASRINDVIVIACGQAATDAAVMFDNLADSFLRGLQVIASLHHGIEISGSYQNTFDSFNVKGSNGHGVLVTGGNQDVTFSSGNLCANDLNGFNVTGGADETLIANCVISEQNGGGCFFDSGIGDAHIRGSTLRNNNLYGVDTQAGGWSVQNCQISSQTTGYGIVARSGGHITGGLVRGNAGGGINVLGDDILIDGCRIYSNTPDGITIDAGADRTRLSALKLFSNTVNQINDSSKTTIYEWARRFNFSGAEFRFPVNSDWIVNDLAAAAADSNNAALIVRRFDDTTEEGVGWGHRVPEWAEWVQVRLRSRAETAPGGAASVVPKLYFRQVPDNAVVAGAWNGANDGSQVLAAIAMPTNEFFQYDDEQFKLSTLGIVPGTRYQFELTRDTGAGGDNLSGDWTLLEVDVEYR